MKRLCIILLIILSTVSAQAAQSRPGEHHPAHGAMLSQVLSPLSGPGTGSSDADVHYGASAWTGTPFPVRVLMAKAESGRGATAARVGSGAGAAKVQNQPGVSDGSAKPSTKPSQSAVQVHEGTPTNPAPQPDDGPNSSTVPKDADLRAPAHASVAPGADVPRNDKGEPLITNVFSESDLRQALSDIASQAGVTIVVDSTAQGTVSADLKDVPLETALRIILQAGGYAYAKLDGYYLVGAPDPSNPNFYLLSRTEVVDLKHTTPQAVISLLGPAFARYLSAEGVVAPTQERERDRDTNYRAGQTAPSSSAKGQSYRLSINAPSQVMDRIKAEISRLDTPRTQVMIEASVLEISQDGLKNLGIDWASRWLKQDLSSGGPNLIYSKIANTEMAGLAALVQNGTASLRANPRVATSEGETAELEVGKESYFAIVTGPVTYPYTTLEQIKSGILLRVTPRVLMPEGEVLARIEPEVRDVTGKGTNGLPEITFRRAVTNLRVKDGQSIVIGGLITESSNKTTGKVPILGDIPLIGGVFQKTTSHKSKSEVVIIITPHVLTESADYDGVQSSELRKSMDGNKDRAD